MSKPLPPLTWFRAFDAAARHLSFTQAANELGLTQSAISQHVRSLEEHLSTPLFVRSHRALHLTDAARLLVPDVAAALARLAEATERFVPHTDRPRLSVATSVSVAQHLIAPHLSSFLTAHPGVSVQIVTAIWPDDFTATNADIEIRFGSRDVVGQGALPLGPSRLHAVAAPARAKEAWQTQPLIQPVGISTTWARFAAAHTREADLFVDTHGMAVDLAIAGAGIALTHSLITAPALADGRLVALPLPEVAAEEGYYLHQKPTRDPSLQEAFVAWLTARIAAA